MGTLPEIDKLRATCARMERRYLLNQAVEASYRRVSERFSADLADDRDILLSRCAALMAIKFLIEEGDIKSKV
ncbi:hypothetical protein [Ochrobactrum quorumnocens]|uniref:hypothetical protein n=1 Tax=Ochrobactrum quorumnocens TaxID=271865 RepID=UPI001F4876F8|nr:hypothetical protein [[Ochrobactrum] quorumnocens]